jgi:hypothetical protein
MTNHCEKPGQLCGALLVEGGVDIAVTSPVLCTRGATQPVQCAYVGPHIGRCWVPLRAPLVCVLGGGLDTFRSCVEHGPGACAEGSTVTESPGARRLCLGSVAHAAMLREFGACPRCGSLWRNEGLVGLPHARGCTSNGGTGTHCWDQRYRFFACRCGR